MTPARFENKSNYCAILSNTKEPISPVHISEVLPGQLYIGNWYAAKMVNDMELVHNGQKIRRVVNMAPNIEIPCYYKNNAEFTYLHCPIDDDPDELIFARFERTINFIDNCIEKESQPVLVHCYGGISRSSTIVLAYLMHKKIVEQDVNVALQWLQDKRPFVCPNDGFLEQLQTWFSDDKDLIQE